MSRIVGTVHNTTVSQLFTVLEYPYMNTDRNAVESSQQGISRRHDNGRGLAPRERLTVLLAAVTALLVIAGVWMLTGRDNRDNGTAMGEVDRPAPQFVLPALAGSDIDLSAYRGRVVLLNFWGTWCEPCKRELPALQAAHTELGAAGLSVIGINLTYDEVTKGNTVPDVAAFLTQYGVDFPIALDMDGDTTQDYRVFPLPTSFFIDRDGRIRYVHIGELQLSDIRTRFSELNTQAHDPLTPR
jgi:thiol-disulfide isomerase/thioredoxin